MTIKLGLHRRKRMGTKKEARITKVDQENDAAIQEAIRTKAPYYHELHPTKGYRRHSMMKGYAR